MSRYNCQNRHLSRRGAASLILVTVFGLLLLGMAAGLLSVSIDQTQQRARYETYKDEFAAAEEALNRTFAHFKFMRDMQTPNFTTEVGKMTAPVLAGYAFPVFNIAKEFEGNEEVAKGEKWEGLTLYRMRYRISVAAKKESNTAERFTHDGVGMSQLIEITYIPLFNFAIFYNPTLEIAPGAAMVINGRVHSNGDTYIQSNVGLDFQDRVTVAGSIFHGRYSASGQTDSSGGVTFTNGSNQVSMARSDSSGWLDSKDSDWTQAALDKWKSYVRDKSHGITPLSLPIPSVDDPHALIERANSATDNQSMKNEKFEYKAGLKIVRSGGSVVGMDQSGASVDLKYHMVDGKPVAGPDTKTPANTKSVYKESTFYDSREKAMVNTLDIDVANMIESGVSPANGILYVSNDGATKGAVRMVNGSKLPTASLATGFSVATNNPLYIKGDYNTVNKTLAMAVGDAITELSNNWSDTNAAGSGTSLANRKATDTTLNAVCINGIVTSKNSVYSGGVENYFRLLEDWGSKKLTFSGSIIDLWESKQATGSWQPTGNYYQAPNRNWAWDAALKGMNGPPGAPKVMDINKREWETLQACEIN